MKHYFILILCFLSQGNLICYSQSPFGIIGLARDKYTVLDSANLKISYDVSIILDTNKVNTVSQRQYVLLTGNKTSKFFRNESTETNQKLTQTRHSDARANEDGTGLCGTEIYKDLLSKQERVTLRLPATTEVLSYNEDIPTLSWKIWNENTLVSGYTCTKATATFRGREYIAWFTPELPINNGPWKLGGLPGLILRAQDSKGYFIFECIGIEQCKIPIPLYDWKYTQTTREKANKLIENMHKNPLQTIKSMGTKILNTTSLPPIPYNPIEKF
jgi:GLPGLI family protein